MAYCIEPATFGSGNCREETLEGLLRASQFQTTSIPSAPAPHFTSSNNSSESADCTFLTDILGTEAFLEHPEVGYGTSRLDIDRSRYHHGREFSAECGCKLSVRAEENTALVGPQTQFGGTSSGEFAFLVSGNQRNRIFYTDDANVKLTHCMRRQCFNCKATETSTWRRSLLTAGKMVCNKCGLFERTHFVPRPERFPRRKTLASKSSRHSPLYSRKNSTIGGAVNHPYDDKYLTPRLLPAHFVDALDPTSGESAPQDMPRESAVASEASLSLSQVPSCYHIPEQPNLYHVDCQSLSSALSEAAIWMNPVDLPDMVC
ncbi:hypothetical protein V8E53_004118 [Lactarius tabidus]